MKWVLIELLSIFVIAALFINWALVTFVGILTISVIAIVMTLASLSQLGDERKQFIKMKAQSNAFVAVVGWMLLEIVRNVYITT